MASGDQVVADAQRYMGVPYLWGGTDPNVGLDCSGLVQLVYRDLGMTLPRTSQEQALVGTPETLATAAPGDLVFYGPASGPTHVGIYAGGGQMIDAPYTGTVVRVDPVGTPTEIRREVAGPSSSSPGSSATLAGIHLPGASSLPFVPGFQYLPGGSVGSSITSDVKHAGAYVALVLAGLGLVVMGAIKTASPGTTLRSVPGKVLG